MTNKQKNKAVIEFVKSLGYMYHRTYTHTFRNGEDYKLKFCFLIIPNKPGTKDMGYSYPTRSQMMELSFKVEEKFQEWKAVNPQSNDLRIYRKV